MKFRSLRVGSLAGALVLLAQGLAMVPATAAPDASLAWVQKDISVKAYEGTSNTQSLELTFSGNPAAPGATIDGNLRDIAAVDLSDPTITSDGRATVTLTVNLPAQAKDSYVGNIQLTEGGKPLPQPLHVAVQTARWDARTIPQEPSDPSLDRIGKWDGVDVVTDQLIVGTADGVANPDETIRQIAGEFGGQIAGSVAGNGLYELRIPGATISSLGAVKDQIAGRPDVAISTYTVLGSFDSQTNDPIWSPKPKDFAPRDWHLKQIDAPSAWEESTGAGVTVGIIDGGFEGSHADLQGNVISTTGKQLDRDHGTHVAGLACASGNNGVGTVGVAYDCGLQLRGMDSNIDKFTVTRIVSSMYAMRDARPTPKVVNISLGFQTDFDCTTKSGLTRSQTEQYDLYKLYRSRVASAAREMPNILWVFSGGNKSQPSECAAFGGLGNTAGLDNVITVAATSITGKQANYSSRGSGITVAAPGGQFDYSSGETQPLAGDSVFSTLRVTCSWVVFCSSEYGYYSGTSMAAPLVAGTAALAFGADPAKPVSAAKVKQCIVDGAKAGGRQVEGQPYYIINARKTVDCAHGKPILGNAAKSVATNGSSAFVLRADGQYWAWGNNSSGQLGISSDLTTVSAPTLVPGLTDVKSIVVGRSTTFAVKNDGQVLAWGDNSHGLLGNNSTTNSRSPQLVPGLTNVSSIVVNESDDASSGFNWTPGLPGHTVFAIKNDGTVMGWGDNPNGVLGNGTTAPSLVPMAVRNLGNVSTMVSQGGTAWAVTRDGAVFAWGDNSDGQLGKGEAGLVPALTPQPVPIHDVKSIVASYHTINALKSDGSVWEWGQSNGIAYGDASRLTSPTQRLELSGVTNINALRFTRFAVKSDGTAWAWGWNHSGEAGVGLKGGYLGGSWENGYISTARQMPNLANVTDLVGGMALTADGKAWQWSLINEMQIVPNPETPTAVVSGASQISHVLSARFVLKADGTLWGWGNSPSLFGGGGYSPRQILQ